MVGPLPLTWGCSEQRVPAVATLFTDKTGQSPLPPGPTIGVGQCHHLTKHKRRAGLGNCYIHAETYRRASRPWYRMALVGATSVRHSCSPENLVVWKISAIEAVLDEQDAFDLQRMQILSARCVAWVLVLRTVGAWRWYHGAETRSKVRAIDGTELDANVFSPNDVLLLANATGAPDIRFDLAIGMSSTRRNGGPVSTEIIINLSA